MAGQAGRGAGGREGAGQHQSARSIVPAAAASLVGLLFRGGGEKGGVSQAGEQPPNHEGQRGAMPGFLLGV